MMTVKLLWVFCILAVQVNCANICGFNDICNILEKCINNYACKHYYKECKCEGDSYKTFECGIPEPRPIPRISTYIVGGDDVDEYEIPWMAAVFREGNFVCGGTIIDNMHIITAAHCFKQTTKTYDITVGVGSVDRTRTMNFSISAISLHPEYKNDIDDIAILRLQTPMWFGKSVKQVCLPSVDQKYKPGEMCIVAGWGMTAENVFYQPKILQKIKVPLIDWDLCQTSYNLLDTQLCAGYFDTGGIDSCTTDSGGPLICQYNNRWTLVGVVSSGTGCARPEYPGKYTQVSKYIKWIQYASSDGDQM